ncbi:pyridine nucleotide-disulfide oxidoreductase [Bacillus manliponensis]|uniref:Pyridine nucleotide-disulfide oxidoreductase n=1 Tax=Bacillus manliponensis TaxID=574376 RepID=A0A073JZX6_9BACI|nr:(2Fe-2S)-binding protein [Bacillus manliponensis]KEK19757.1 pyridine nucleotide-disulfide oxidoreductase [Bacillus manliponensis]
MSSTENMIICRCEEVTYEQIRSLLEQHQCSARELKLRTRAGMGFCGGRTCRVALERMLEGLSHHENHHNPPLKYQPPIRPISFGMVGENQ